MLQDYEQELTTKDGQAITATAYGTKSYDNKAAVDDAVGEPLHAMYQVVGANFNNLTSLDIEVYGDDDGAGTGEVSLVKKTVVLANLTVAKGVQRIGIIPPGTAKAYLRGKCTVTGTNPTTGKIKIWLQKGTDVTRANAAGTF